MAPPAAEQGEGRVFIHSGFDGTLFRTVAPLLTDERRFGRRLANLGDRDGDGLDELGCVSRSDAATFGSVIQGLDGTFLTRYTALVGSGFSVDALASAPDIDRDGVEDVLVHGQGAARYYSGDADVVLDEWSLFELGLGHAVPHTAGYTDFDGDGQHEHLLGYDYLTGAVESRTGAAAIIERRSPAFIRADVNQDDTVDLSDAMRVLEYLFQGNDLPCLAAADVGDDLAVDISDAVLLLGYLFIPGSTTPAAPFPTCGTDLTDPLPCGITACPASTPLVATPVPATGTLPPLPLSPPTSFFGSSYALETVVFCVDTSASLGWGGDMFTLQTELTSSVESLERWQLFDIVAFNTTVSRFNNDVIHGSDDNVQSAVTWIDGLTASGTSCMQSALLDSVAIANRSPPSGPSDHSHE